MMIQARKLTCNKDLMRLRKGNLRQTNHCHAQVTSKRKVTCLDPDQCETYGRTQ